MKLLSDEQLAKLNSLQLQAKQIVEGFLVGLHKSPYHGFSVEFADHRQYNPGESLKDVDWRIVARTGRYYVKRYEEETNLRCFILLDHSNSMSFGKAESNKLDFAKRLAAALSILMIDQKDAVGLYTFHNEISSQLAPKAIRSYLPQIFLRLSELKAENQTEMSRPLKKIAESIRKRSLIVIISDLLEDEEEIVESLKQFRNHRNEVILFHIYEPNELNFYFKQESDFIDSETGEKIRVNPWQIKRAYQEMYGQFYDKIKEACYQLQVDYHPISSDQDVAELLHRYLNKRRKGL